MTDEKRCENCEHAGEVNLGTYQVWCLYYKAYAGRYAVCVEWQPKEAKGEDKG